MLSARFPLAAHIVVAQQTEHRRPRAHACGKLSGVVHRLPRAMTDKQRITVVMLPRVRSAIGITRVSKDSGA